jgi:ubiquitin domain-containing protein
VLRLRENFIKSWEAVEVNLEFMFKEKCLKKIQRREYVLERSSDRKEIGRHIPWDRCLSPRMQFTMDMLLVMKNHNSTSNNCRTCRQESHQSVDSEVIW